MNARDRKEDSIGRTMLSGLLLAVVVVLLVPAGVARGQWVQDQKLTASDADAEDVFGYSVSISGDVAIVGASSDDDAGAWAGSAYMFGYNGVSWVEEQKLTAADPAVDAFFGYSASIDGNAAIVGAAGDDYGTGSAYVFRYNGASWIQEQKLMASDGESADVFGCSVSISGDVAMVGADANDDAGIWSGSAYVFRYNGASWVQEQKLTASDAEAGNFFGNSVSISGSVGIVGAVQNDDAGTWAGSAYVFRYNGASWVEEQKLTASDAAEGDAFGGSASISGDVAVVGASHNDDAGGASGSAYVFRYNGASWVEDQKLTASDAAALEFFGSSVSITGDVAIVGTQGGVDYGANGAAYVFRYNGASWVEDQKLTASDAAPSDAFGAEVAISGNAVIVGAYGNDDAGDFSGSAYVFRYGGPDNCPDVHNPLQGDADEDGVGDLCDPCPGDDTDSCDPGGTTVAEVPADETTTLTTPDGNVILTIPAGCLDEDTTISITQTDLDDPRVNFELQGGGDVLVGYILEPSPLDFNCGPYQDVTLTIKARVSGDSAPTRLSLVWTVGAESEWEWLGGSCRTIGGIPGRWDVSCTGDLTHFSMFGLFHLTDPLDIPALSQWGLVLLSLALLGGLGYRFGRRRVEAE